MSIKVFSQDEVYEFIHAWEHRFRQHILSRIPRRLRAVISPDDVLQDVRLAVRAQLEVFKGTTEKAMNTWLTRLTTGCTLDAIKSEMRIKRGGGAHAINQSVLERSSVPDLFGVIPSPQRTPSSLAATDEAILHALDSLKWLNPQEAVIVRMYYLNEMSERRIAECLKCRLTVVRGIIWRTRSFLAATMGDPSKFYSDA
ncbi:MAG: hypothetical protein O7D91_15095 [Planctomycetota bacterium]|nr:hypothetical protein [Planctomycetota bacterium]